MVDNHRLLSLEPGGAPIHLAGPNIATILNTLAMVLGAYHAVLDLVNAFFSIILATESQDQFAFTCEGHKAIMDLSSASSRLPAQPHNTSWNGSPRPVPVLLSLISKKSPLH